MKVMFPFGFAGAASIRPDAPRRFVVTSSGHSGSIWLAGSLNLHEDVLATVGLGHPLQAFRRYSLHKDVDYMLAHATPELLAFGWHQPTGCVPEISGVDAARPRDLERLPSWMFDELERVPSPHPFKAIGSVHALVLAHLYPAVRSDPALFRGDVAVAELIRHPLPRTESAIRATQTFHLHEWEPRGLSKFIDDHAAEFTALERRHRIDFSEPRARAALIVFRVSQQNDMWAGEMRDYPRVHRVLLERLQTEPEYFAALVHALTHGAIVADRPLLERVFTAGNLGSGRQSTAANERPIGAREQYERWSSFEREEFAAAAHRLSLPKLCLPFGYDFSFVERPAGAAGSWFDDLRGHCIA